MMSDHRGPPDKQEWPQSLQRDVILEVDITPHQQAEQPPRTRPAPNPEWEAIAPIAGRSRHYHHFMSRRNKLMRQQVTHLFDSTDTRVKEV
jgi:hypothetical protein